ncbi:FKBP-type peptidyl-prolyl cis-trans isomerase [Marinobacter sp.]|uniref:FKBP-type peptidyl-prolyl cis-trans isomerase n=1 Tax=Marinobacter sp. TaxID=50741 RepID=UPI0035673069
MKKTLLAIAMAGIVAGCSTAEQDPSLETTPEKISYGMGLVMGERISADLPDLQMQQFIQGFKHGQVGNEEAKRLTREEIQTALLAYQEELQGQQEQQYDELAKKNKEAGEAFLAENAKRDGVQTTESGLQYEVIEEGDGETPTVSDRVQVHYTGELINGDVFDSSRERGQPTTFGVGQVIPGWVEGLQLMSEGSRYKLFIPSDLAYGASGNQAIAPNETLIFDVELLKINP